MCLSFRTATEGVRTVKQLVRAAATVTVAFIGGVAMSPQPAKAYQIDCAILLCLSGGWPASAPCVAAKAEFMRRITPWPVEPPLQIWRCPMRAGYEVHPAHLSKQRLSKIALAKGSPPRSPIGAFEKTAAPLLLVANDTPENGVADIDIGGPAFDFVRSIRVFSVEHMRQRETGPEGEEDCRRSSRVRVGRYGVQGDFYWRETDPSALPDAYIGDEGWGKDCPFLRGRSVLVDWADSAGNYGYEQVYY